MNSLFVWASENSIEIGGTVFGLIYVWFSIKQNLLTWPAGIISSLLYCWVFFNARFYAQTGLQVYYVLISVYGWWSWHHSSNIGSTRKYLTISFTDWSLWVKLILLNFAVAFLIYYITGSYTNDSIPLTDSFIASLSVIATWMLARKKIEQWLIWIFVDLISAGLYLYRGLYPTVLLFIVYAIMAGIGFLQWRKEAQKIPC
ncbi:MAG: nicotinamide riboside transporter PnuC [Mariniphaga sp.]